MLKRVFKTVSILYIILVLSLCFFFNVSNFKAYFWKEAKPSGLNKRVQIWGKAAISHYLWNHILNGSLEIVNNGFYQKGNITIEKITFEYYSGPGYIQTTLPQNVKYLILVLNGRTLEHTIKTKEWLDYLTQLHSLKKLAVIILGNENCNDDWIVKYLKSKGGIINVLFIVYDSPLVDDKEVYQWPLGVATYRGFPNIDPSSISNTSRKYVCNFVGTVYKNSSRQKIVELISESYKEHNCYIGPREQWLAKETEESLRKYIEVLNNSMYTLSPAGKNPECYRLYEAISLGSIPVIVTEKAHGQCINPPLRLLTRQNIPVIRYTSWEEALHSLLISQKVSNFTSQHLISWYASFKRQLAQNLVQIIKHKFFIETEN